MTDAQSAEGYIPARLKDILAALGAHAPVPVVHGQYEEVIRLIEALFHYQSHASLQRLHDLYYWLDPDRPRPQGSPPLEETLPAFESALRAVLQAGNFEAITPERVRGGAKADLTNGLRIVASDAGVRGIHFFVRGGKDRTIHRKTMMGLRRRQFETEVFEEVVLFVALVEAENLKRRDRKAVRPFRNGVRPGSVLVKHFRNVGKHELMALHPGAAPSMRATDQVFLGVPALAGGIPLLLQIGPALTVIFAVVAAYLGFEGVVDDDAVKKALAALSGLVALGAFVMRQWVKYERQTLKYQKKLADTVYFRNVANNSGVLDGLVGAAEQQDVKEAALGYWALLSAEKPLTRAEIDAAVEAFLRERMKLEIDFEIQDALGKLEALGLIAREGETYTALAPAEALGKLDEAWDTLFRYTVRKVE